MSTKCPLQNAYGNMKRLGDMGVQIKRSLPPAKPCGTMGGRSRTCTMAAAIGVALRPGVLGNAAASCAARGFIPLPAVAFKAVGPRAWTQTAVKLSMAPARLAPLARMRTWKAWPPALIAPLGNSTRSGGKRNAQGRWSFVHRTNTSTPRTCGTTSTCRNGTLGKRAWIAFAPATLPGVTQKGCHCFPTWRGVRGTPRRMFRGRHSARGAPTGKSALGSHRTISITGALKTRITRWKIA